MTIENPMPYENAKITLSDGRVAVVVEKHHASPVERWKMWRFLTSLLREGDLDGETPSFRKRFLLRLMFLTTVLNPNCVACRYEVRETHDE